MFCGIFLTNILQNRRKRISAKLLDDGTRHGHTLSQPAHIVEQPSTRQRNAIQMFQMLHSKRGRKECGGGGVGDRLESPVETQSMFEVFFFFCMCCCFFKVVFILFIFWGEGGGKWLI